MDSSNKMFRAYGIAGIINDATCFDVALPESSNIGLDASKMGKVHTKGNNGTIIYKYNFAEASALYEMGLEQCFTPKSSHRQYTRTFNALNQDSKYAVKVMLAPTYHHVVSAMKEAEMNDDIFNAAKSEAQRKIVCKPYFCMHIWDGKKWVFIIVTEFAKGKTLKSMQSWGLFNRKKVDYEDDIEIAINRLWWMGFTHNLERENIIYDTKTKSVKIIGLSHCVALPLNMVVSIHSKSKSTSTTCKRQHM